MTSKLTPVLVNSLVAAFCGLMLMWFSHTFQYAARTATDKINSMLYYPELPARELRFLVQAADHWVAERRSIQERARVLEQENIALRTALQRSGINPPQSAPGLLGASVTLRYPDAWWKEIRIDKGSSHGVVAGAPVLSEGFMIGRVSRTG
ncbi:MAG: rod shape-determining protein MreC, partial [Synergistaceae bacterium]|nr:rod shape-determining protein MreC [Synergistaceae bacterium]